MLNPGTKRGGGCSTTLTLNSQTYKFNPKSLDLNNLSNVDIVTNQDDIANPCKLCDMECATITIQKRSADEHPYQWPNDLHTFPRPRVQSQSN